MPSSAPGPDLLPLSEAPSPLVPLAELLLRLAEQPEAGDQAEPQQHDAATAPPQRAAGG